LPSVLPSSGNGTREYAEQRLKREKPRQVSKTQMQKKKMKRKRERETMRKEKE
jgi:hypothetical protein